MLRVVLFLTALLPTVTGFAQDSLWQLPTDKTSSGLLVGYDRTLGESLYVCRATLMGSQQIGYVKKVKKGCNIAFNMRVYTVDQYFVLKKQKGRWQAVKGKLPSNATKLGRGLYLHAPLSLCRANVDGSVLPGKTWPQVKFCEVIYQDKVMRIKNYAVWIAHRAPLVKS